MNAVIERSTPGERASACVSAAGNGGRGRGAR